MSTERVKQRKREELIRGQRGRRESEWHQRHGFPPVHLSTQNKQGSHKPDSSCYVVASNIWTLLMHMRLHTHTETKHSGERGLSSIRCPAVTTMTFFEMRWSQEQHRGNSLYVSSKQTCRPHEKTCKKRLVMVPAVARVRVCVHVYPNPWGPQPWQQLSEAGLKAHSYAFS